MPGDRLTDGTPRAGWFRVELWIPQLIQTIALLGAAYAYVSSHSAATQSAADQVSVLAVRLDAERDGRVREMAELYRRLDRDSDTLAAQLGRVNDRLDQVIHQQRGDLEQPERHGVVVR